MLLNIGKISGLNVGDKLTVELIEMIDGQKYPQKIGTLEVSGLAGENLSEAVANDKKSGQAIAAALSDSKKLECTLLTKK